MGGQKIKLPLTFWPSQLCQSSANYGVPAQTEPILCIRRRVAYRLKIDKTVGAKSHVPKTDAAR